LTHTDMYTHYTHPTNSSTWTTEVGKQYERRQENLMLANNFVICQSLALLPRHLLCYIQDVGRYQDGSHQSSRSSM